MQASARLLRADGAAVTRLDLDSQLGTFDVSYTVSDGSSQRDYFLSVGAEDTISDEWAMPGSGWKDF